MGDRSDSGNSGIRTDDIVSVYVPRYRRKSSHIEFVIEASGRNASWQVYRRYQQFKDLHAHLAKLATITNPHHTAKGVLPPLPGTSWMRVTSEDVDLVEKRRLHLEIYLQQLLVPSNRFYRDCEEVKQFLHQDEMPLCYKAATGRAIPGINAPLDFELTAGPLEKLLDDVTDEDRSHGNIIASKPNAQLESAIAPEIPSMQDWGSAGKGRGGELAAMAGALMAPTGGVGHRNMPPMTGVSPQSRTFAAALAAPHLQAAQAGAEGESKPEGAEGAAAVHADPTEGEEPSPAFGERAVASSVAIKLPYEVCANCGHRDDIDYDLAEWTAIGRCPHCGVESEHDLVLPPTIDTRDLPHLDVTGAVVPPTHERDGAAGEEGDPALLQGGDARRHARLVAAQAGVPPGTTSSDAGSPKTPQAGEDATRPADDSTLQQAAHTFDARCDVNLSDFELITTLGRGTFGKVMKARYKVDGKIYAIKALSKTMVNQKRMVEYVKEEKAIMACLPPHPFVVQLHFAFQTDYHLYFVMDFLPGGELYAHMQPPERLPLFAARFYACELLLAIEHIHRYDVCHRDLKPENVVLNHDGHIKVTDFGLARRNFTHKRRYSFVGSAEYLSPEVVKTEAQTKALDWWTYGCMVFEMLTGRTPFHAATSREVYAAILNRPVDWTKPGLTADAIDLLQRLLDKNPRTRLQDASKIKRHPFFNNVNWDHVVQRKVPPPFVPGLQANDTKYFAKEFTSEWATIPPPGKCTRATIERLAQRFSNFFRIPEVSDAQSPTEAGVLARRPSDFLRRGSDLAPSGPRASLFGGRPTAGPSPFPPAAAESIRHVDPDYFVGVWRLLRVELASTLGQVSFPWGAEVAGQLIFTPNGLFAMQLCPIKRVRFRGTGKATAAEMAEAFQSYVSCFGNYFVAPGKPFIVQCATASLSPTLAGVMQKRYFEADPEAQTLTLTTQQFRGTDGPQRVFSRMTWYKVA